jgi:hypothetical protein
MSIVRLDVQRRFTLVELSRLRIVLKPTHPWVNHPSWQERAIAGK